MSIERKTKKKKDKGEVIFTDGIKKDRATCAISLKLSQDGGNAYKNFIIICAQIDLNMYTEII